MFYGEYRHSCDTKNRLSIPSKLRSELGNSFIVTRGLDKCLNIYTTDAWNARMEELMKLPQTKKEVRIYIRTVASQAVNCECDAQGRIQLPAFLKEAAMINKQCVITGALDHVEIWAEEKWEEFREENEDIESIAEIITEMF